MPEAVQPLTDDEVQQFVNDLDLDQDGHVSYQELERKLDDVYHEIAPKPQPHHLHHESRSDDERHAFLRTLVGDAHILTRDEFASRVKSWGCPSLEVDKQRAKEEDDYLKKLSPWRRVRAFWAVEGPQIAFTLFVAAIMVALGVWQLVKYLRTQPYRAALGWGVVVSKTCAGVLYPTFFFLILSMSRWLSTFLRRFYIISRFINWDVSQSFHIKMSIVALFFATLHAIGHLGGSFVFGSKPGRQQFVAQIVGPDGVPKPYISYVRSLPGWSGLTSLGLFYLIALLSMPPVRRFSYEIFQLAHLLMFPMIGLLMAHGTAGLLQFPMFGYWLAFPTLLVIVERTTRLVLSFLPIDAELELLDDDTVAITAEIPAVRLFNYKAGQYVLLQIPQLSRFQWHPFTVSTCNSRTMQVHIKADGDWTNALRDLAASGTRSIKIGLDGPFGAPAQRFYDFEYAMVFGAGIGVTPFSGILTDLQTHELSRPPTRQSGDNSASATTLRPSPYSDHRRVDFHWMVRERNQLLWFSTLLNEVWRAARRDSEHFLAPRLDVRLQTYVTRKRKDISTHVFRWLLEKHRTPSHPYSAITGLENPTTFGRPDLGLILEEHYKDMCDEFAARAKGEKTWRGTSKDRLKVGIFFCGPPVIGEQLADRARQLTARARLEGRKIEYHFMIEVFG